jgi:hypothetical protein
METDGSAQSQFGVRSSVTSVAVGSTPTRISHVGRNHLFIGIFVTQSRILGCGLLHHRSKLSPMPSSASVAVVIIALCGLTQLPHRCTDDRTKAAENCGVPEPLLICGAKNRRPSEGFFVLTGSVTMCSRSRLRKAFRSSGRQKSRLCHDFGVAALSKLPYQPREVWCLRNLRH